jgi:2-polyprenyl-3-methyl-5-hydroxy-6-metoxy-1,4-benzoquinol methylase
MSEISARNDYRVYAATVRPEMSRFVPETAKRILDVGCSVGNFGEFLKSERSIEVWGVEVDEQAAEVAAKKLDNVICGGFGDNLNLPVEHFDCIIFNDVLEHMVDPQVALVYAKQLLRDGGKIVASIPNVRYFDNLWSLLIHKNWEYVDSGILDKTHLRFFTVNSIPYLFRNSGYNIDLIEGINPLEDHNPYHARKFRLLNKLLLKKIEDTRWLQFAVVASPCL